MLCQQKLLLRIRPPLRCVRTSSTATRSPFPSRGRLHVSLFCKYGHLCCPRRFGKNLTYPCCVDVRSRSAPKAKAWVKPSRRLAGCRGGAPTRAPQSAKLPLRFRAQEWVNLRRRRKEGEPSRRLQSLWGPSERNFSSEKFL